MLPKKAIVVNAKKAVTMCSPFVPFVDG